MAELTPISSGTEGKRLRSQPQLLGEEHGLGVPRSLWSDVSKVGLPALVSQGASPALTLPARSEQTGLVPASGARRAAQTSPTPIPLHPPSSR